MNPGFRVWGLGFLIQAEPQALHRAKGLGARGVGDFMLRFIGPRWSGAPVGV